MRRFSVLVAVVVAVMVALPVSVSARGSFPATLPLPNGFYPEGIAVGKGHDFYVGSLLDGAVYKGDLRTGRGNILVSGFEGGLVAGLSFDVRSGLLWGIGFDSGAGRAFVFDGRSGDRIATVEIPAPSFPGAVLNDIVVTRETAYITDSVSGTLWSIPLDRLGRPAGPARPITLSGDFKLVTEGDFPINLNGIDATSDGRQLVAVHSALGVLYRIDPATGTATQIDLGDDLVLSGDGIVLHGNTLYVVQNFLNQVAVVSLNADLSAGRITNVITSDLFRVPATAAKFGNALYLVNARFDVAVPPVLGGEPKTLDYDVVRVPR